MKLDFTSVAVVAATPVTNFISLVVPDIPVEVATAIHDHAMIVLLQTVQGTGLGVIDGKETPESKLKMANMIGGETFKPVNLGRLFGDLDNDICDDCNSTTSPTAYLVEILQFLRNNNLNSDSPNTGKAGIEGTVLQNLFARRPDLSDLELTYPNNNTVLPYLDLANEVMESFVVHLGKYINSSYNPKRASINTYNSSSETSGELLSEPQVFGPHHSTHFLYSPFSCNGIIFTTC